MLISIKYFKGMIIIIISAAFFFLIGCENAAPVQSSNDNNTFDDISRRPKKQPRDYEIVKDIETLDAAFADDGSDTDPTISTASGTLNLINQTDGYQGITIKHPSGAALFVLPGTLVPPDYIPWGDPVTITMNVEKDTETNQLIFSFGPSGCEFLYPATLWLSWEDLESESADLFYIEADGTYTPQKYDGINIMNKVYVLTISHFSRYSLAYSN